MTFSWLAGTLGDFWKRQSTARPKKKFAESRLSPVCQNPVEELFSTAAAHRKALRLQALKHFEDSTSLQANLLKRDDRLDEIFDSGFVDSELDLFWLLTIDFLVKATGKTWSEVESCIDTDGFSADSCTVVQYLDSLCRVLDGRQESPST